MLNFATKPLDKAILLISDKSLDWKPIDEAMTASRLAFHIYEVSFIYMVGTLKGVFNKSDYAMIPFDINSIKSAKEIVDYGNKVKAYIRENLPKLTEEHLTTQVTYNCWGGVKIGGFESLSTILEEIIHHRGQLALYLRMLGIKPPFIYDFT